MSCKHPPALTDDDLSAVLDGEAPAGAREHLASCPDCAARLARAEQDEHAIKMMLYRWDCPSADRLGQAELGLLPEPEIRVIRQHLSGCHACASEVEELRRFLASTATVAAESRAEAPEPVRHGSAREFFGALIATLLPREMAVSVRGGEAAPLVATAPGITVVLDPQPASPGYVLVVGQVAASDQEQWTGALVELRQGERVQVMTTVDELGGFRCGPVTAGRFDLRITPESGQMVVLSGLPLGDGGA